MQGVTRADLPCSTLNCYALPKPNQTPLSCSPRPQQAPRHGPVQSCPPRAPARARADGQQSTATAAPSASAAARTSRCSTTSCPTPACQELRHFPLTCSAVTKQGQVGCCAKGVRCTAVSLFETPSVLGSTVLLSKFSLTALSAITQHDPLVKFKQALSTQL